MVNYELKQQMTAVFTPPQVEVLADWAEEYQRNLVKVGDFNELKEIVRELGEAQRRTEVKVEDLTDQVVELVVVTRRLADSQEGMRQTQVEMQMEMQQSRAETQQSLLAMQQSQAEMQTAMQQSRAETQQSLLAMQQSQAEMQMATQQSRAEMQMEMQQSRAETQQSLLAMQQSQAEMQMEMQQSQTQMQESILAMQQSQTQMQGSMLAMQQSQTEMQQAIAQLARGLDETRSQMAHGLNEVRSEMAHGLSEVRSQTGINSQTLGYMLENEAYRHLPAWLKEHHDIEVVGRMIRRQIGGEEINFLVEAQQNGEEIVLVGESKSRLHVGDLGLLTRKIKEVKAQYADLRGRRIVPLLVAHFAPEKVLQKAAREGVIVVQSFDW